MLASKGDFMPTEWTSRLSALFDSMPPRPWPQVRKVRQSRPDQKEALHDTACLADYMTD